MSGRIGNGGAGGDVMPLDSAKQKIKRAVSKLKHTLPTRNGKFTPDLRQVGLSYLQGDELGKFLTEDRANFSTYGMDEAERAEATLKFDPRKAGLVDSTGELANVNHRVYNVTSNGRLIYQPDEITGTFNHSSITRDGAVICAGYLSVENGKIKKIDTSSGHYQPTELDLYNAIELLASRGDVFAPDCVVGSHGGTSMSPREFLGYMNEDVEYSGRRMPRVASMRQERIDAHESIDVGKIIKLERANIIDAVLASNIEGNIEEKGKYLFNFAKDQFPEDYVRDYAFRIFGEEGHDKEIRSVSLTPNELLATISTISDPRIFEASVKIIENFADIDPTINFYIGDPKFRENLSRKLLSPEKLPNTLRHFNVPQINTLLSSLPEGDEKSFVITSFLESGGDKEVQILGDVQSNLDANTRRIVSTTLLSRDRFEDTYARLDSYKIAGLVQALPDDRKGAMITGLLERRDAKSLELLSNNIGSFEQAT